LARLGLLTGTNSQDWKSYDASLEGVLANAADLFGSQASFWWPWPTVALAWLGVLAALASPWAEPRRRWRLLPGVMGLSSLLFFTLVVGRTGPRFALPLGFWLSLYVGAALAAGLRAAAKVRLEGAAKVAAAVLLVAGLHRPVALALTQRGDARHEVERFLDALPAGARVETYGLLVYQPHFHGAGSRYQLARPELQAVKKRNPLYGAQELVAPEQDVGAETSRYISDSRGLRGSIPGRDHRRGPPRDLGVAGALERRSGARALLPRGGARRAGGVRAGAGGEAVAAGLGDGAGDGAGRDPRLHGEASLGAQAPGARRSAAISTCQVWGNISRAARRSSRQPWARGALRSRPSVGGSQET
jgi:hypothetical protein